MQDNIHPRLDAVNDLRIIASARVRAANAERLQRQRDYVLYWMIAARRASANFALDHAIAWAQSLQKPLIVFEALRLDYPYASPRLHRFVLDGMHDNRLAFEESPALYFPYVEHERGAGKGLLYALARQACVVITDDFPCFFLPRMVAHAASQLDVMLQAVDSNGVLPLSLADRAYSSAHHFRKFLHHQLPVQLQRFPRLHPFDDARLPRMTTVPEAISARWPAAPTALLSDEAPEMLQTLDLDHDVPRVEMRGGAGAAQAALEAFLSHRLEQYSEHRSDPDRDATSRLSPYLHFGHLSVHQVVSALAYREHWTPDKIQPHRAGARTGWWGLSESAESFLDELITWRELAYNGAAHLAHYETYASLPEWARATLEKHRSDPRAHVYTREQFEAAQTHDALWNASQRQLMREGWFHNTMRMLWAKKILEWSATPEAALHIMSEIMNRWSLDGRNPNSYAGYAWTLGRYDRPWPERPIYGTVRAMSSDNTARKREVADYLRRYGESDAAFAARASVSE